VPAAIRRPDVVPAGLRRQWSRIVPAQVRPGVRRWRFLVPVVCLVAGLIFAISAHNSGGSGADSPVSASLAGTVQSAEQRVRAANAQATSLQAEVDRLKRQTGRGDSAVAAAQARVSPLLGPAGLTAVSGPGLLVVLDDAHSEPTGVDPNELVVHQSDLQAVVNALWAGGAEAMTISGQRVIATSAVRCVGNTLLLNGAVYSPPFRVAAIGPAGTMQDRLDASPGVQLFRSAAEYYGLGYTVEQQDKLDLPAYSGPVTLSYATAGR
jgi:uncharacterized protein YlxW (UPF0749 family)